MMLMPKLMVFGLVFAGLAIPAVAARTVRVMSYNIRMGAGSGKWVACPEGDPWHLPEVATTHFPLKKAACAEAARVVVRELAKGDKPVILCGDFNSLPDSEAVAELKKGFVLLSDPSKVTCPTEKPDQCIDYIFVDRAHAGRVKASGYTVGDSKASDHLPLWIDLEIAGVPGPAVTCPLTKATTEIQ